MTPEAHDGPPERPTNEQATVLLGRLRDGDSAAGEQLLPLVYEHLRQTADNLFRHERPSHTLQPTALVHEAYVRLVQARGQDWTGLEHFCAVASIAMRRILTDHARRKRALKRGGGRQPVPATAIASAASIEPIDALALDEILTTLAEIDPDGARIIELRFFGGLTNKQIAGLLGVSVSAVDRRWRRCKAFIRSGLGEVGDQEGVDRS